MTRECEKADRKQFMNFIFKELINMEDNDIDRNIDDFYRDRKLKIIYMDRLYIQSNIIILFNTKDSGLFFSNERSASQFQNGSERGSFLSKRRT